MLEVVREIAHYSWLLAGKQHQVQHEDGVLSYYRVGRGPHRVMLIHGMGDRAVHWHLLSMALWGKAELIIPDLPGCGRSTLTGGRSFLAPETTWALLHQVLEAERGQRPVLVGHSLGGVYVAKMLLDRPGAYAGGVMINPGGFMLPEAPENPRLFRELLVNGSQQEILERVFYRPAPPWRWLAPGLLRQMRAPAIQDFVNDYPDAAMITGAEVARLPETTLLVCGKEDRFLPPGTLEGWARHFPGEVHWEPASAHATHVEKARPMAHLIGRFLDRLSERAIAHPGWA